MIPPHDPNLPLPRRALLGLVVATVVAAGCKAGVSPKVTSGPPLAATAAGAASPATTPAPAPSAAGPKAPAAPKLTVKSVTDTVVTLAWSETTAVSIGFRLERSADGRTWKEVVETTPDVTGFTDAPLSQSTVYQYRVTALDAAGSSPASAVVKARTLDPAPPEPTGLTAVPGGSTVGLRWASGGGNTSGFLVVRRVGGPVRWVPAAGTSYQPGPLDATQTLIAVTSGTAAVDTGLGGAQAIDYAVFAVNPSSNVSGSTTTSTTLATPGWVWSGGGSLVNQPDVRGTLGTSTNATIPGARSAAATCTDASGVLWLYGGLEGTESTPANGMAADLWKYDGTAWTWTAGAAAVNGAATATSPGARSGDVCWHDAAGKLWIFGGDAYYAAGSHGATNDLYRLDGSQWTRVGGTTPATGAGSYGSVGVAAPGNTPGVRTGMQAWTDAAGAAYVFGGNGVDGSSASGPLNDLWKYDGTSWTWLGGAATTGAAGVYGTKGTPAAGNWPGARSGAAVCKGVGGKVWLFGGTGVDAGGGAAKALSDLWSFDGREWTWIAGSSSGDQSGVYGTMGTAAAGNAPGGRSGAALWCDAQGSVWLFGGNGFDQGGTSGALGDLWRFDGTSWAWEGGSDTAGATGSFGSRGVAATSNVPSARADAGFWSDLAGNLWIFGGTGTDASGASGALNDAWQFVP